MSASQNRQVTWTDEKGLLGRLWLEGVIRPDTSKEDARARLRISSGILSQRDKRNTSHSHSEAWYRLKSLALPKVRPRRKYGGNSRLVLFLTSHQNPTRPCDMKALIGGKQVLIKGNPMRT